MRGHTLARPRQAGRRRTATNWLPFKSLPPICPGCRFRPFCTSAARTPATAATTGCWTRSKATRSNCSIRSPSTASSRPWTNWPGNGADARWSSPKAAGSRPQARPARNGRQLRRLLRCAETAGRQRRSRQRMATTAITGQPYLLQGAPRWSVNVINLNLFVTDTPLWYDPPIGPPVRITLSYNSQSSIAHNEPFGNKWQFNYGSYLVVDTAGIGADLHARRTLRCVLAGRCGRLPPALPGPQHADPDRREPLRTALPGRHGLCLSHPARHQFAATVPDRNPRCLRPTPHLRLRRQCPPDHHHRRPRQGLHALLQRQRTLHQRRRSLRPQRQL